MADAIDPLQVFRFQVEFRAADGSGSDQELCKGAFSEVSGLEATMEPVAISEGGRNWGQPQRVGRTTFSTVILRRGMTTTRHLWTWFKHVSMDGQYRHRLQVTVVLQDMAGEPVLSWKLEQALPVKLKVADLNAAGQEVGVEELHLVHEGIVEEVPERSSDSATGGEATQ